MRFEIGGSENFFLPSPDVISCVSAGVSSSLPSTILHRFMFDMNFYGKAYKN